LRWGVLAAALLVIDCGARTDLALPDRGEAGGAAGGAAAGGGGGTTPVEPPCLLEPAGPPIELIALGNRHAQSPRMVAIDPGDADGGRPARVAINTLAGGGDVDLHSDIQLVGARIGERWPDDVVIEQGPDLFGIESHGWAEMARAPGGREEIAIAWHSDPGFVSRVAFRTLRTDSWTPGPNVDLSFDVEVAVALVPGAGVGRFGVGHLGDGYAVALRELVFVDDEAVSRMWIAVLDPAGAITLGPHEQGLSAPYPGFAPSLAWTGESYLIATGIRDCDALDGCRAPLTLERLRPASGDRVDDSGIDLVWAMDTDAAPRRPSLASLDGRTWLGWAEGDPDDPEGRMALRLAEVDPTGELIAGPIALAEETQPQSRLELWAARFGLALGYAEDGDRELPDELPGRSRVVVHHLGGDGSPASPTIAIDTTRFDSYGPPMAVPLAHPRGFLVTWSGRGSDSPFSVIHLALLRCTE
jgi:hypothetical protein